MKNSKIYNYFDIGKTVFKAKPIIEKSFKSLSGNNNYFKQQTLDNFLLNNIKLPLLKEFNNITNNHENYFENKNINDENKNNRVLLKYDNITLIHNQNYNCNNNINLFSSIIKDDKKIIHNFKKKFIAKKRKKHDDYYKSNSPEIYNKFNKAYFLTKIKKLNSVIRSKNNIISDLNQKNKDFEEKISLLNKQLELSNKEIIKCRLDISKMLKDISKFIKDNKNKFIIEQEYYYENNKNIFIKNDINKMKYAENCHDGKEITSLKEKLKVNEYYTDILNKNNNDLLTTYKLDLLNHEKAELTDYLKQLIIQKDINLYHVNLYEKEKTCTFSPYKIEGPPFLCDRYQIIELIGKGGYSEVYKAYDVEKHIFVACKLVQINDNWNDKIKDSYIKHTVRENLILKNLDHPNIVKLLDTIEINNFSFCNILEYCTGPNLGLYILKNGPVNEKIAKIIVYQILQALSYLNKLSKKIIHYDLKPDNIIFNDDMTIKITDFGLSKIIDENYDIIRLTSQGVGTYWYLPPECFIPNKISLINTKVDIWSL